MKNLLYTITAVFILFAFTTAKHPTYEFNIKAFEKNMVLIPGGTYHSGVADNDRFYEGNMDPSQNVKVDSFYMFTHEVSNGEYLYFLTEIKKKDSMLYKKMLPDTQVWRQALSFNEPFTIYYFRHPAYQDFPVVGISYDQASYYCLWLTERYMGEAKRKHKKVKFRLPSVNQWTYAAMGGRAGANFPWAGFAMQDEKGRARANFNMVPQQYIYRADVVVANGNGEVENKKILAASLNHGAPNAGNNEFITTTVSSYWPNDYGLYNMAGNVEEYVIEKGITKGGSWRDPGYYLQNFVHEKYDATNSTSAERGFRFVMEMVK